MKSLYFVRHGESADNAAHLWSRRDSPLTELGREQARATGRKIKEQRLEFDLIVVSPLPRTYETAHIIAGEVAYPPEAIQPLDLLIERDWGELVGTSGLTVLGQPWTRPAIEAASNVEKLPALQLRAEQALRHLQTLGATSILIVGHGAFGRALRRAVHYEPYTFDFDPDKSPRIENAEIITLI
jgi:broad specificity phosphatase PhoE